MSVHVRLRLYYALLFLILHIVKFLFLLTNYSVDFIFLTKIFCDGLV